MKTIATAHGYEVRTNGRTYFVSDGTQCRLATTSKAKAMNCLKSCLKHEGRTVRRFADRPITNTSKAKSHGR
jgi:hypothetical protein